MEILFFKTKSGLIYHVIGGKLVDLFVVKRGFVCKTLPEGGRVRFGSDCMDCIRNVAKNFEACARGTSELEYLYQTKNAVPKIAFTTDLRPQGTEEVGG